MIDSSDAALRVAPCGTMLRAWLFVIISPFSPELMRVCRDAVFVETQRPLRYMRPLSDSSVRTTIASAHYDGGAETTTIGPVADQGCTVPGGPGDAIIAHGLVGFSRVHRRQHSGEPPYQHRFARPWGTKEEDVVGRTPASPSASRGHLDMTSANMAPADAEVGQV
jgi:hypothetical protein